jgi:secreted PhoX family phosphatase
MRKPKLWVAIGAALVLVTAGVAAAAVMASGDFGQQTQEQLANQANKLFGVGKPIDASSTTDLNQAQAIANPSALVTVAKRLDVKVVSAGNAAAVLDQMVLWPQSSPRYIIAINEEGPGQPSLQKINLATGVATTIVSGTNSGDPVRVTPWGTILFGEEGGDTGAMYEIIDPLSVEGATINRTSGVSSSPKIRRVGALGFNSFEGLAILPNGVTYYGNELSANAGAAGGAYYKFVPTTPWAGGAAITSLDQSPYASGSIFALRVGTSGNNGQGFQYGRGSWQSIAGNGVALRPLAVAVKATGYYRPEDIDIDTKALAAGNVRFCGNNTGRDSSRYFGEVICFTDGTVAASASGSTIPEVTLLVQGSEEFNMPDNIAYQASRGNWIVHEDGSTSDAQGGTRNNDLWDCLDDGQDDDTLSDGCVRIGTLNDLDAEWTGGFFDASGKHFYVSVQHNSSGFGTILDITGWN